VNDKMNAYGHRIMHAYYKLYILFGLNLNKNNFAAHY